MNGSTISYNPIGGQDAYIIKLDDLGEILWSHQLGGTENEYIFDMDTSPDGGVLVSGHFQSTVDFDLGAGTHEVSATGTCGFVLKLDSDGEFQWVRIFPGSSFSLIRTLNIKPNGNILATGTFTGLVYMDEAQTVSHISQGQSDILMIEMDPDGEFQWSQSLGGESVENISDLVIGPENEIYVVGRYLSFFDFDTGPDLSIILGQGFNDVFVIKMDSTGLSQWWATLNGTGDEAAHQLAIDDDGNIHILGAFENTLDFDPGTGIQTCTSIGNADSYLWGLNSDGEFLYCLNYTENSIEYNEFISITDNVLYLAGTFDSLTDFDVGPDSLLIDSQGSRDGYLARYDLNAPCMVPGITSEILTCADSYISPSGMEYFEDGEYEELFTAANGCDSVNTYVIDFIELMDMSITELDGTLYTADEPGVNYQWYQCGTQALTLIEGADMPSFTPTSSGSYTMQATQGLCTATALPCVEFMVTQIPEYNEQLIHIFPNPSSEGIFIDFLIDNGSTDLEISNISGEIVYRRTLNGLGMHLIGSELSPGIYFLRAYGRTSWAGRIIRN